MKKFSVFLLILFFLPGCQSTLSPEDGDTFAPPNWIRGNWSDESGLTLFEFTDDNIFLTTMLVINNDFLETYSDNIIVQNKSITKYEISIENLDGEQIENYRFEKSSDTTLNYYKQSSIVRIGPVVLTKELDE